MKRDCSLLHDSQISFNFCIGEFPVSIINTYLYAGLCELSFTHKCRLSLILKSTNEFEPLPGCTIRICTGYTLNGLASHYPCSVELEKFYKQHRIAAKIFQYPELNSADIFLLGNTTIDQNKTQHVIAATLPRLFPDFRAKVTESELSFFRSMLERDKSLFMEKLEKFIRDLPKLSEIRSVWFNQIQQAQLNARKQEISRLKDIADKCRYQLDSELAKLYTLTEDYQRQLNAIELLQNAPNSTCEPLANYMSNHPNITIISISGSRINYRVTATLDFYDSDSLTALLDNTNSVLYETTQMDPKIIRRYYSRIFLEEGYKIKLYGSFCLKLPVQLNPIKTPVELQPNDYLANPHIERYGCMGNNLATIHSALANSNYPLAIEQSVASVRNINFNDYTVLRTFAVSVFSKTNFILDIATQKSYTPSEFISTIKE